MTERNLCTESGCKAHCCSNAELTIPGLSEEQVNRWFPTAKKAPSILAVDYLGMVGDKGVYWNGEIIRINGQCPNVEDNYDCRLGEDRPPSCKNFQLGGKACTGCRLKHLIPPYHEWVQQNGEKAGAVLIFKADDCE